MLAARKLAIEIEEIQENHLGKEAQAPTPMLEQWPARSARRAHVYTNDAPSKRMRHKYRLKVKTMLSWVVFIAVFLFMGGVLLLRYEKLTAINSEVNTLKDQIKQLRSTIEDQQINIEFAMDIVTVQEIAAEKLEMGYPRAEDQQLLQSVLRMYNEGENTGLIDDGNGVFDDLFVEPNKNSISTE